jgi:hypothetical protein
MTRQCPFDGCKAVIHPRKFACYRHWYKLSGRLQREIWDAYTEYVDGRLSPAELRERQKAVLIAAGQTGNACAPKGGAS